MELKDNEELETDDGARYADSLAAHRLPCFRRFRLCFAEQHVPALGFIDGDTSRSGVIFPKDYIMVCMTDIEASKS